MNCITINITYESRPIGEMADVHVHGEGDVAGNDPGHKDEDNGALGAGVQRVLDGFVHGEEAVNADPNEAVDGGGREQHVKGHPDLQVWIKGWVIVTTK